MVLLLFENKTYFEKIQTFTKEYSKDPCGDTTLSPCRHPLPIWYHHLALIISAHSLPITPFPHFCLLHFIHLTLSSSSSFLKIAVIALYYLNITQISSCLIDVSMFELRSNKGQYIVIGWYVSYISFKIGGFPHLFFLIVYLLFAHMVFSINWTCRGI